MASTVVATRPWVIHPLHAAFLGGVFPFYLATLLADYAYWSTYQIQWANFAAWLLVGAMVLTTLALLGGVVGLVRGSRRFAYVIVLAITWVLGFVNSLHHARDAWAVMPGGLVMSVILTLLALVATVLGLCCLRNAGGVR